MGVLKGSKGNVQSLYEIQCDQMRLNGVRQDKANAVRMTRVKARFTAINNSLDMSFVRNEILYKRCVSHFEFSK